MLVVVVEWASSPLVDEVDNVVAYEGDKEPVNGERISDEEEEAPRDH